jgi:peptide/nickel transport system permease protein
MLARLYRSDVICMSCHRPAAIIATLVAATIICGALLCPWIAGSNRYNLASFSSMDGLLPPLWQGYDARFPLGTGDQGRDMISSILYGARLLFSISLTAMAITTALGVGLGLVSGYHGGGRTLSLCGLPMFSWPFL